MMRSALHVHLKVQEAVSMNQEGVNLLEECHSSQALKFFQGALRALHEIESTCTDALASSSIKSSDEHQSCVWSGSEIPHIQDDRFFVHNQALLIQLPQSTAGISLQTVRVSLAAVCFNMGLAFHLKGKLHNRRQRSCHEKAALCYAQALQYMEQTNSSSSAAPDVTMMTLLALNNQCQIHYQLRSLAQLQSGLERIRKLSLSMLWHCGPQRRPCGGRMILGELMINVLVSTNPGVETAAAA
ncbi:expressed unknown protein [Seminavis robusta]|uniref:Uncharacterized protein n=1 Tax=Seminavis robusta TaxID=568900 RepID=A0A9N8HJ21_9STRA|nr:expressed unknown protein [Seminavis robusta]|eukprot:Sro629_g178230.1 n/a (242) ;mRNA; r:42363-43088